jgi:UDP:flavonoid glycosyltransferase YjiC (YdhE family)
MRVLFTCVVGPGHFNPMAPLALAFRAAGHDVAVATDPGFAPHVRALGFAAFPAGMNMDAALRQLYRQQLDWRAVDPRDRPKVITREVFGGLRIEPMLRDLQPLLREWRPDLLVHDSAELAGPIAAEVEGIPHAEHAFGVLRPMELRRIATEAIDPVCRRLGVANPGSGGTGGERYLDICPPSFQRTEIADVPDAVPIRPDAFDDAPAAVEPAWLSAPRPRPLVYATLGTEFNKRPELFRAILDGLADEPLDVVLTIGMGGDPDLLAPVPGNAMVERWIPQSRLLPRCAAFVSHGGSGALFGALRAGVPIVAMPQGADQFLNADRIAETGIGRRLEPDDVSPAAVRDAVRALIDDPAYGRAIAVHRASLEAMPPPADVAQQLAAWVAG